MTGAPRNRKDNKFTKQASKATTNERRNFYKFYTLTLTSSPKKTRGKRKVNKLREISIKNPLNHSQCASMLVVEVIIVLEPYFPPKLFYLKSNNKHSTQYSITISITTKFVKILRCASYFQHFSQWLILWRNTVFYCFSCLTYCIKALFTRHSANFWTAEKFDQTLCLHGTVE